MKQDMRLFDTHCHFETTDADAIREILVRAKAAGVEKLMAVGGSPLLNESAQIAIGLTSAVPLPLSTTTSPSLPQVLLAQGFDRDQVGKEVVVGSGSGTKEIEKSVVDLDLKSRPAQLAAFGEIGLDYHYSPETRDAQMSLFAAQLEEARKRNLPVVIHTREADDDTLGLLREIPSSGVIHCYTGTPEAAKKFLDLGFYISISGIVTFKAAQNVRDSALVVPDDRILIETDSPYLAPVPMRGNPNEPAYIRHTCEFLAALRGTSAADFAELTFKNGERMLGMV